MSRGLGVTAFLHELLAPVDAILVVLTQLGDTWFLLALAGAVLWLGPATPILDLDRHQGLLLLAALLLAATTTGLLKAWIDLPRPVLAPEAGAATRDLLVWATGAAGPGFPSGHAVAATVGYGSLAHLSRVWTPRRRWALAGGLVALVCLTRLALGAHYLVDVIAGVAIGFALLGFVVSLVGRPEIVLGLALAAAVAWLARDVSEESLGAAGAIGGVLVGWSALGERLRERASEPPRVEARTLLALGALLAGLTVFVGPEWLPQWELGGLPVAPIAGAAIAGLAGVAVPAWHGGSRGGSTDGAAAER